MESTSAQLVHELFALYDRDGDRLMSFSELRQLFHTLAPDRDAESHANAAAEALLTADADMDHALTEEEFGRLLGRLLSGAGVSLEDGVPKLLEAVRAHHEALQTVAGDDDPRVRHVADAVGASGQPDAGTRSGAGEQGDLMSAVFDAFDSDASGRVSFRELVAGLAKWRPIKHKQDLAAALTEAAAILTAHDTSGDRHLQRPEFAEFITTYLRGAGFPQPEAALSELLTMTRQELSRKVSRMLEERGEAMEAALAAGADPAS